MKDTLCYRFFLAPHQTLHRRYEALRAVCVDRQPQTAVAKRFGSTYDTLRRLVSDFRAQYQAGQRPPFSLPRSTDARPGNAVVLPQRPRTTPSWLRRVGCR
jgi:hypothetical protein